MVDDGVLAELRASVQDDTAFVSDLIDAYVADGAQLLDAIEAAVQALDAEALIRPAHTLKSSSATLGAMALSASARTLEMAGRAGTLDDPAARDAAARIHGEWEAATAAMREWIARAPDR